MTDDGPDDASLVRATLAGRVDAFGRLYDRYAPLVRTVCFDVTRDLVDAQDLNQDVFLRAYRKLGVLRRPEQFGPWVVGIARHAGREWRRGIGRRRKHLRRLGEMSIGSERTEPGASAYGAATETGNTADVDDDLPRLREAIASLPPREREALHLLYLNDQPADEAARLLGLSRSGFYRSVDRAKKRLRQLLARLPAPPGGENGVP